MTAKLVHYVVYDRSVSSVSFAACDEVDVPLYWHQLNRDKWNYELTSERENVTCEKCKHDYEHEAQPVTTKDVLELAQLVNKVLHAASSQLDHVILDTRQKLTAFADRMARPRDFATGDRR